MRFCVASLGCSGYHAAVVWRKVQLARPRLALVAGQGSGDCIADEGAAAAVAAPEVEEEEAAAGELLEGLADAAGGASTAAVTAEASAAELAAWVP